MLSRHKELSIAIVILIALLTTHFWIHWSGTLPEGLKILTFALVCIFLSWSISAFRRNRLHQSATPPPTATIHAEPSSRPGPRLVPTREDARIANAFTIDLEDYFHTEVSSHCVGYQQWEGMPSRLERSGRRLLDILDESNTKATVFVLGWSARHHPGLVREIAHRGHEIACHSFQHRPVFRLDPHVFYADTLLAKEVIEDAAGVAIRGYRAPNFSITPGTEWAFQILAELGFLYDSSVNPIHHPLYGNPRGNRIPYALGDTGMIEIPIATWRIARCNLPAGGGAYLRLLPYQFVAYGLKSINRHERRSATIYVHPWEIDDCQPVLSLDWKSRVRQTWGTSTMEGKLNHLLMDFRFAPIASVYKNILATAPASRPATAHHEQPLIEVIS